jgi:hypothetical protein
VASQRPGEALGIDATRRPHDEVDAPDRTHTPLHAF